MPATHNDIGHDIIGAAFEVRKESGKGFREMYYEAALAHELRLRGHKVDRQVCIPVKYKEIIIDEPYRADIIVDNKVIIELKALRYIHGDIIRQLITYLKLSGLKLGYIINFGASDFCIGSIKRWDDDTTQYEKGIYRLVNGI